MVRKKDVDVLLVEDDPGDVELTREAMKDSKMLINLHVVGNGVEAMKYLKKEGSYKDASKPDMILLDLNLPKKDGREVLDEIKSDTRLKSIPVVVLTTSQDEWDFKRCYELGANCCVTKPIGLEEFAKIVKSIREFWLTIVKLPSL